MGLIIKQGKQDTSQDNKFNPIEEKNVLAEITKIALSTNKNLPSTLEVTMQILSGAHKNRCVIDRVCFDPSSPFSWKYRALRKCAGVPYHEDESVTIDIEEVLLHRAVKLDLGIRTVKDKNGEDQQYQNINYKKIDKTENADTYKSNKDNTLVNTAEDKEDFIDEDEWETN